jgi:hypothetical protein
LPACISALMFLRNAPLLADLTSGISELSPGCASAWARGESSSSCG